MSNIYCLKCHEKTASGNVKLTKGDKTNRVSCICAVCGSKKSLFVNKDLSGAGVLSMIGDLIDKAIGI